jgi:F-type H+-transporting ATPase subunit gamma
MTNLPSRGVVPRVGRKQFTCSIQRQKWQDVWEGGQDLRYAAGTAGALHIIYNCYKSVNEQVPAEERLLPLDLARLTRPASPTARALYRYLPAPALLAGLMGEYALISRHRAAADSFAGEQASRLVAMDGATRNTEKMLDGLLDLELRKRQGQVIKRVLELVGARFTAK